MDSIEQRLRRALADTHENEPRPLAELELPFGGDRWLTPTFMSSLRRAAVLAPVVRRQQGYSMLLTRRSEAMNSHKGQISFPGGRRDEIDTSAAANALREAQEEVGLDPSQVDVLGYLNDYPTISRYRVTPVVGLIDGGFTAVAAPAEVAEVFEIPMEIVLDPRAYQRKSLSREGLILPFYELNWGGYRVWGATAGMLRDLCKRVHDNER